MLRIGFYFILCDRKKSSYANINMEATLAFSDKFKNS